MNSYARFRLALTEDTPTIKPYREDAWANLPDAKSAPVELSLNLLDALHGRWVILLRSMDEDQFSRVFEHPEVGQMSLGCALALYAWHGRHHLAQLKSLRTRRGWSA
jgi:DinB family protein